ncbi:MAG: histidine kinase [Ferruginibacter sp.]
MILLSCLPLSAAQAQPFPQFNFTRLTTKDGLPSNVVTTILKDSRGFLWLGTLEGLCRYDGKNMKTYRHDPNNKNSLVGNNINQLFEDKQGRIWADAYISGISCLDVHNDRFTNYTPNEKDSLGMKGRYMMCMDNTDNVFNNAPQWLNKTTNEWRSFPVVKDGRNLDNVNPATIKNYLVRLNDSTLWQFGYNGIFALDTKAKKFTRRFDRLNDPLCFFKDHSGRYWYGDWVSGLNEVLFKEQQLKNYIPASRIGNINEYQDINGKYWIVASEIKDGKIITLDPVTGDYNSQLFKPENELIPNTWPGFIYMCDDHKLWVASSNGIFVSEPTTQSFKNKWLYDRTKPFDPFYDGLVRTIFKVKDQYAVAQLNNGLHFFDSTLKETRYIKQFINREGKTVAFDVRAAYQISNTNFILAGPHGAINWNVDGTYKFLCKAPVMADTTTNYDAYWRGFLRKSDTEFWVMFAMNYIGIYNVKTNAFTKTFKLFTDKPEIECYNITYDHNNTIWVSSNRGIYHYDRAGDRFVNERLKPGVPEDEYNTNNVSFINTQEPGFLWISTNAGLLHYNITTKESNCLANSGAVLTNVYKTIFDNRGKLWIANYAGLTALDTATQTLKSYTGADGLPLETYSRDIGFMIDQDKQLLFGGYGAFTLVDMNALSSIPTTAATVAIMHLQGKDSLLPFTQISDHRYRSDVRFKDFPVQVLFNLIDFSTRGERKYYYKMDAAGSEWLPLENGVFSLNTIKPGNYEVWLTGNVNGVWCQNPQSILIHIIPEWYQTQWFKALCSLLIVIASYLFFRWRVGLAKKAESQQTEIQRLAAEQFKNELELSQITNFFTSSLLTKTSVDEVLWDVARNLIGLLSFEDCMIYLWNPDKTKMVQKAGYGPKGSIEELDKQRFDVLPGQGVVGYVMQTMAPVLIADTASDNRYRMDEMNRASELCIPIMYNDALIGVIDSEHHQTNFYTQRHVQLLTTIAALVANKIQSIESEQHAQQSALEVHEIKQQLQSAQLDALRSQMNPHFIFNSLNSIENFILKNERLLASEYLGKFSKLVRRILDSSKSEQVSLDQEIETLKIYIELEQLRMNGAFNSRFEISKEVLEADIQLPPMLMQPYVENAILHGLRYRNDDEGVLLIKMFLVNGNAFHYITEDNGVGRAKAAMEAIGNNKGHQSYGTAITQSRIDSFNQLHNSAIAIATTDLLTPGGAAAGTRVELIIPL